MKTAAQTVKRSWQREIQRFEVSCRVIGQDTRAKIRKDIARNRWNVSLGSQKRRNGDLEIRNMGSGVGKFLEVLFDPDA